MEQNNDLKNLMDWISEILKQDVSELTVERDLNEVKKEYDQLTDILENQNYQNLESVVSNWIDIMELQKYENWKNCKNWKECLNLLSEKEIKNSINENLISIWKENIRKGWNQ